MFHRLGFVVRYLEHCSFNVKHWKRDERRSRAVVDLEASSVV